MMRAGPCRSSGLGSVSLRRGRDNAGSPALSAPTLNSSATLDSSSRLVDIAMKPLSLLSLDRYLPARLPHSGAGSAALTGRATQNNIPIWAPLEPVGLAPWTPVETADSGVTA